MSVKFKINELGLIRDSEIDFNQFMIFSGDSNVGKSYTAFLVYHFTSLFEHNGDRLEDFFKKYHSNDIAELRKGTNCTINFNAANFIKWFEESASEYIGYLIGNKEFKCNIKLITPFTDFNFNIKFRAFHRNIEDTKAYVHEEQVLFTADTNWIDYSGSMPIQTFLSNIESNLSRNIATILLAKLDSDGPEFSRLMLVPILLPPARAGIVGFNFSEKRAISNSAGMYKEFIEDIDLIGAPVIDKSKPDSILSKLLKDIFQGEIKITENGMEYHTSGSNSTKLPITAAASSIKELAPLFPLLNKYHPDELSILFEEPEAHLHPAMQQKLTLLLAYIVNQRGRIQVTTHSDYFLNQINNLIKLYLLKNKNEEKFREVIKELGIDESLVLDPAKIGAYYFEKQDGFVKIIKQDVRNAGKIPFDTFRGPVEEIKHQMNLINDSLEEV